MHIHIELKIVAVDNWLAFLQHYYIISFRVMHVYKTGLGDIRTIQRTNSNGYLLQQKDKRFSPPPPIICVVNSSYRIIPLYKNYSYEATKYYTYYKTFTVFYQKLFLNWNYSHKRDFIIFGISGYFKERQKECCRIIIVGKCRQTQREKNYFQNKAGYLGFDL